MEKEVNLGANSPTQSFAILLPVFDAAAHSCKVDYSTALILLLLTILMITTSIGFLLPNTAIGQSISSSVNRTTLLWIDRENDIKIQYINLFIVTAVLTIRRRFSPN
jgi:hypothetical protein